MRHAWVALGLILFSQVVFAAAPVVELSIPAKKITKLKKHIASVSPSKKNGALNALFKQSVLDTFTVLSQEVNARQQNKIAIPQKKQVVFTVVIDAGHGGHDNGAEGPSGQLEKNVVLAIARQLARQVNQQPNMHALLTRKGDYYVPLRKRLALARKGNADLFVAIHADAYLNASAHGASVYALSMHGATTEAARWLAQRDNYAELSDIKLNALSDNSPMVRSVLIDLEQTATIRDSVRFASTLLDQLNEVTKLHYKRVEQAPFMVLKSPDIPSVLVETGFISNPREEKLLANAVYQKKIADAIFQGIQVYREKISFRD